MCVGCLPYKNVPRGVKSVAHRSCLAFRQTFLGFLATHSLTTRSSECKRDSSVLGEVWGVGAGVAATAGLAFLLGHLGPLLELEQARARLQRRLNGQRPLSHPRPPA